MNTNPKPATTLYVSWNARTDAHCEEKAAAPSTPLEAYHAVCTKYSDEIRAIQKYFPGWKPLFSQESEALSTESYKYTSIV